MQLYLFVGMMLLLIGISQEQQQTVTTQTLIQQISLLQLSPSLELHQLRNPTPEVQPLVLLILELGLRKKDTLVLESRAEDTLAQQLHQMGTL